MWLVRNFGLITAVSFAVAVSGCSEVNLLSYGMKKKYQNQQARLQDSATPDRAEIDRGTAKIGKPYQIDGIWYYPQEDPNYDETGIASWYGEPFHGRRTANGAIYDMNQLTAAHKTLPLPTNVRVTNLENGRSIIVTVNDRGPFAHSRIIDLSRRSAELLGIIANGTAKVRVQAVNDEGDPTTEVVAKPTTPPLERTNVAAVPQSSIRTASLAPPPNVPTAPAPVSSPLPSPLPDAPVQLASTNTAGGSVVSVAPVTDTEIYIQAGAFIDYNNANKLSARLSTLGPSKVSQVLVNGQDFYRVRVGPVYGVKKADQLLANIINAGHTDARIVIE